MKSRLLPLPCELRLQIYENVLICKSTLFCIQHGDEVGRAEARPNTQFRSEVSPALLRICRQIHLEAAALLYSKNRFFATSAGRLEKFLYTIGPRNAGFIRWLGVRLWAMDGVGSWYEGSGDGFINLTKMTTGLRRLEINYMNIAGQGLGKNTRAAHAVGESLWKMEHLQVLVISGFYGKNWPAFFATKTNAVVEAYAGNLLIWMLAPGSDTEWSPNLRSHLESSRRALEEYQEGTSDLLAVEIETERRLGGQ